ncbi:glycosyltransferase family 4 protein [Ferrimicrobium acidiphilum]|uniref:glycosyltransferase family 4 protein n=1 Tax=Ferrimicrobium acidiphilum TaxID=121039 RepID=UPI0023F4A009|nr:glycosyltransferase family 4 protein [Ferrimicrobium acidiphilum]
MMRHVLITNDFLPKVGGIQAYLGEIYSRLDPESFLVITTRVPGCEEFDRGFGAPIVRLGKRLLPTPATVRDLAGPIADFSPDLLVYDPIVPIGVARDAFEIPYALIAHGAEVRVPAYLPVLRAQLRRTIQGSRGVIAAGGYPAEEVRKLVPDARVVVVPPGIDRGRFCEADDSTRASLRRRWMQDPGRKLVLFVSRLVPRKGADTLLRALAAAGSMQGLEIHIVGDGRDRRRLNRLAMAISNPVVFHGRLDERAKIELYQAADVFVFPARDRWLGVEQEGFGIVILEAQACGTPAIVGASGGTPEALVPSSGQLLRRGDPAELAAVLRRVIADSTQLGSARRATSAYVREHFDYDQLSKAYESALCALVNG